MELDPTQPRYEPRQRSIHPADEWTPVLVAVVNNARDLRLAREAHWYRIPVRHAPRQIAAEYLALYQTGAFGDEGRRIHYYAPILRYHLTTRRQLLPEEPDHPHAEESYFKLELGELLTLPAPIPAGRQTRITFIYTTLAHLFRARDVSDLWLREAARQKLYAAVRERGLAVECWYPVAMGNRPEADLALFGPDGRLTLYIDEPTGSAAVYAGPDGLHLDALALLRDAEAVLDQILTATRRSGNSP
jgi:hypothetical protein